ncbi:MAG: DUF998 domain-containing protein, partial [Chloroflexota bacterium]
FSAPVFVGLLALPLTFARRFARWGHRGWARYSVVTAIGFTAAFALTSAAFGQNQSLVSFGGLFQRVTLSLGLAWLTLFAAYLQRLESA